MEVNIRIGKDPKTDLWYGVMTLTDGKELTTESYGSKAECKAAIDKWLSEQSIEHEWNKLQ